MKKLKIVIALVFLVFLSSCVEINENITINKNGSGEYSLNMDMSKLLEMMKSYLGKEEMEKQIPENKKDTTINFSSIVDTSTSLTAEKKALLREGKLHMNLNMDSNLFKTDLYFPFKSTDQLQEIYKSMGDGSLGTGQLLKNLSPGDSSNDKPQSPDLTLFNSIYNFTCRNGFISRTVNEEKFKELKENPEFAQMKQAGDMGISVPYTTTIHLPKPAKKITNTFAVLSTDKKTITIKYNLSDLLENPEKFAYTIEY